MTNRGRDPSFKDCYSQPESRLNQQIRCEATDEGCPVIESGTVCGETDSLNIFQEFRQIYNDCLKKLEACQDDKRALRRLAPFRKLVEDLWEQNVMLVEAVEELEQEATCTVSNLQDKLNRCCQKEIHCTLKTKEREVECLSKKLLEKDEILKKYYCQIEQLQKDVKNKNKKYREILKQLKAATQKENLKFFEDLSEDTDDCDLNILEKLFNFILKNMEDQRNFVVDKFHSAECQLKAMTSEKKIILKDKNEMACQIQVLNAENDKLLKEILDKNKEESEKEGLLKNIEQLKLEKKELMDKIGSLQENLKDLNSNFKETRWALTSEVAEKHDQVQELRRVVVALEEQLRQADMQTHFKDDIIKELRKELKASRKSERRGLYDVVTELRGRANMKNEGMSTDTFVCDSARSTTNQSQSSAKYPESDYYSATSFSEGKSIDDGNTSENVKLQSQLENLKKTLKIRLEQLREQEELTSDVEEELARTKMDLTALQEKCERQERRCKTLAVSSLSEPGVNWHYAALSCAVNRIEETLKSLSNKHSCGISSCKVEIEQEIEKIRSVKNDLKILEINTSKSGYIDECENKGLVECQNENQEGKYRSEHESQPGKYNVIHLEEIETFREKAVTAVVTLEQMKEQIDILEGLTRKYIDEFPYQCEKSETEACAEKLEKLRDEFDDITDQLCCLLQKLNEPFGDGSYGSFISCEDTVRSKVDSIDTYKSTSLEDIIKLKCECERLQKEICDQEKVAEKLRFCSKQLEEELQLKRNLITQHSREIDSRVCEIVKLRETVRGVSLRLKQMQCGETRVDSQRIDFVLPGNATVLCGLFEDLQEFWCVLDKSAETLFDIPQKLREDNEKLREKLGCLEKCIFNKEETLRVLQDTVKLRECQIEELKSKMQTSETQSCKLAQDVEEKCRLIANLQEAVRKCKQFEENLNLSQVEFELCELDEKLKKSEKKISLKNQQMEILHNEVSALSSKNFFLTQEIKMIVPRLKSMYKICHLFEKMINELQSELKNRECEVESLYGKIKELEEELDFEFKKCENRAFEDSKCIEELSVTLKNVQNELCCVQKGYNLSIADTEQKLKEERKINELRESDLTNTICQLQSEIKELQSQVQNGTTEGQNLARISDLECLVRQAESRQQMYDKKIAELQQTLEVTILEHEEERKNILQKLCDEKKEMFKNKTLITQLNENLKCQMLKEKSLKDCIDQLSDSNKNLKVENEELKREIEVRKKLMSSLETVDGADLSGIEELICDLKIQKDELKEKCSKLKAEIDKESKLKNLLEDRVQDLNSMLECKLQEFGQLTDNYSCSSSMIQQTLASIKEVQESLLSFENDTRQDLSCNEELNELEYVKKLLEIKTAENAKLFSRIQIIKVEMESLQTENAVMLANKDALISRLRHKADCLENNIQGLQTNYQKLSEENNRLQDELTDKEFSMQNGFREKHKEISAKLREAICEKNDLLVSLEEVQKQLEQMCLENVNKEKVIRELSEECSRLKVNNDTSDNHMNKSDKIICELSKEVKNLHCELSNVTENYNTLSDEYQALLDQLKCCERKKSNLEKLYVELNNENKELEDIKSKSEREVCELRTVNALLKENMANKTENCKNLEEKKMLIEKIKELTMKIKTLEKKVIFDLEQKIAEKNCSIEKLKLELREANISSQRMRNEALRVIQHTKKYLAAQRCANETLKTRLECSNKRGNILGAENRELEEQLKAVTRMNEFLLCQLESAKTDGTEIEPRSFSPLPWGCSVVERDTSSSEYLAESGIQSMQPSPTNMDYFYDYKHDVRRASPQWNSLKKNKYGGSVEYPPCRSSIR